MIKFSISKFLRLVDLTQNWIGTTSILFLISGTYFAFIAPEDYQQRNAVQIMYMHVPAAWMSLFIYSLMAMFSGMYLVWRHNLYYLISVSASHIGACFAFITLVTGSLWGKPMWGSWWVWDARLTSMLILFFFYLGYIALNNAFDDQEKAAKSSSILSLVGFINVPIVKFSVDFFHSLHQGASIFRKGGPLIHYSMLAPILLIFIGFMLYFIWLVILKVKTTIILQRRRRI